MLRPAQKAVGPIIGQKAEEGAQALTYASTSPAMQGVHFVPAVRLSIEYCATSHDAFLATFKCRSMVLIAEVQKCLAHSAFLCTQPS